MYFLILLIFYTSFTENSPVRYCTIHGSEYLQLYLTKIFNHETSTTIKESGIFDIVLHNDRPLCYTILDTKNMHPLPHISSPTDIVDILKVAGFDTYSQAIQLLLSTVHYIHKTCKSTDALLDEGVVFNITHTLCSLWNAIIPSGVIPSSRRALPSSSPILESAVFPVFSSWVQNPLYYYMKTPHIVQSWEGVRRHWKYSLGNLAWSGSSNSTASDSMWNQFLDTHLTKMETPYMIRKHRGIEADAMVSITKSHCYDDPNFIHHAKFLGIETFTYEEYHLLGDVGEVATGLWNFLGFSTPLFSGYAPTDYHNIHLEPWPIVGNTILFIRDIILWILRGLNSVFEVTTLDSFVSMPELCKPGINDGLPDGIYGCMWWVIRAPLQKLSEAIGLDPSTFTCQEQPTTREFISTLLRYLLTLDSGISGWCILLNLWPLYIATIVVILILFITALCAVSISCCCCLQYIYDKTFGDIDEIVDSVNGIITNQSETRYRLDGLERRNI